MPSFSRSVLLAAFSAALLSLSAPQVAAKQLSINRCWTCPGADDTGAALDLAHAGIDAGAGSDAADVEIAEDGESLTCIYSSGVACVYSSFTGTIDSPEPGCPVKARPQPCSSLQQRAAPAAAPALAKKSPTPREVEEREPHPAPSKRAPAPSKRAPAPSKRAPAPSKRAPAPSKRAPAPSKRAPAPSKRAPAPSARAAPGLASRALDAVDHLQRSAENIVHAFQARWSWAMGKTEVEKREAAAGSRAELVGRAVEEREAMYVADD